MKRETLLKNLKRLIHRIETEKLPCEVLEVIGIGSFFRGKESPKDIDILLRLGKSNPPGGLPFWGKDDVVSISSVLEVAYRNGCESPQIAIENFLDGEAHDLCRKWLAKWSWKMIDNRYVFRVEEHDILQRYLRTAGIQLVPFVSFDQKPDLKACTLYPIWTPTSRDVEANITALMAPKARRSGIIGELRNFDQQMHPHEQEINWAKQMFAKAVDAPHVEGNSWYSNCHENAREIRDTWENCYLHKVKETKPKAPHPFDEVALPPDNYDSASLEYLSQRVEVRRQELNEAPSLIDFLYLVLEAVIAHKTRTSRKSESDSTMREFWREWSTNSTDMLRWSLAVRRRIEHIPINQLDYADSIFFHVLHDVPKRLWSQWERYKEYDAAIKAGHKKATARKTRHLV